MAEFPNAHLGVEVLFKIGLNHTQCFPVAVETADHQRPSRDEIMKGVDQAACTKETVVRPAWNERALTSC